MIVCNEIIDVEILGFSLIESTYKENRYNKNIISYISDTTILKFLIGKQVDVACFPRNEHFANAKHLLTNLKSNQELWLFLAGLNYGPAITLIRQRKISTI